MNKQFKEWWLIANQTLKCDQYDAYEIWQQAQKVAVPDGYVVVPKEPTEEMLKTGLDYFQTGMWHDEIYKAMIEAQEQSNE